MTFDEIQNLLIKSLVQFGTTTLAFSYALLALIIIIGLIIAGAYGMIPWIWVIGSSIILIVLIMIMIMIYQYAVSNAIRLGINTIELPSLPMPIPVPPVVPIPGGIDPRVQFLEDSVEE